MKKLAVLGIVVSLIFVSFLACGKKAEGPGAGAWPLCSIFSPRTSQGVVVVDFNRAINTQFADKAIKEDKNQAKYQEFIKETGIDPQKDIHGLAVALAGQAEGTAAKQEAVVVVSLKYDKDLLLAKMKKDGAEIKEETYQGVVVYSGLKAEPGKPPASAAFLDASTVVVGTDGMVRKVIDVFREEGGERPEERRPGRDHQDRQQERPGLERVRHPRRGHEEARPVQSDDEQPRGHEGHDLVLRLQGQDIFSSRSRPRAAIRPRTNSWPTC